MPSGYIAAICSVPGMAKTLSPPPRPRDPLTFEERMEVLETSAFLERLAAKRPVAQSLTTSAFESSQRSWVQSESKNALSVVRVKNKPRKSLKEIGGAARI